MWVTGVEVASEYSYSNTVLCERRYELSTLTAKVGNISEYASYIF